MSVCKFTATKENLTDVDFHNLEVVRKLFAMAHELKSHAKAINSLFYVHAMEQSSNGLPSEMTSKEMYCILCVVDALNDFKMPDRGA